MTWVGDTLFARLLRVLARLVCRYPEWFIYPQILLFVLSVVYTTTHWTEDMDQDNLVGGPTHQVYMKFRQEFPGEDELAVVVQSDDMERNRQFVETAGGTVGAGNQSVHGCILQGRPEALGRKALLFAPEDDLKEMQTTLKDYRPFIEEFTRGHQPGFIFRADQQTISHRQTGGKRAKQCADQRHPGACNASWTRPSDSLSRPGTPVSPGVTALFGKARKRSRRMYITFAHGQIYLVTARPRSPDVVSDAVERMRELMQQTEIEVPGLNVGLTGKPVLDYDEMQQSKRDAIMATIVSLVICSLIFIYAYRETGRPLKAVACLIIGLGYTMAFTFLVVGHLNILTITFAPILDRAGH